jgi:hypothetical protein
MYSHIQCNSVVWEAVINVYYLRMALWSETCSKIIPPINSFYTGNVNEILTMVSCILICKFLDGTWEPRRLCMLIFKYLKLILADILINNFLVYNFGRCLYSAGSTYKQVCIARSSPQTLFVCISARKQKKLNRVVKDSS